MNEMTLFSRHRIRNSHPCGLRQSTLLLGRVRWVRTNCGWETMLSWCWVIVVDGGPTLTQHWINFPCLMKRQPNAGSMLGQPCGKSRIRWEAATHWTCWFNKNRQFTSKHETQCWYSVGPPSATLAQHCIRIGWMSRVCWQVVGRNHKSLEQIQR